MTAPGKLHIGFVLPTLGEGGAVRVVLTLAQSLIERGHRIDLVVDYFRGVYRAGIPQGIRLYHPRLPGSDGSLLRHCRRRGIEVNALTINPMAAVWALHNLRRKHPSARVGRRQAVFAWVIARYIRLPPPPPPPPPPPTADVCAGLFQHPSHLWGGAGEPFRSRGCFGAQ